MRNAFFIPDFRPGDGTRYRLIVAVLSREEAMADGFSPERMPVVYFAIGEGESPMRGGTLSVAGSYVALWDWERMIDDLYPSIHRTTRLAGFHALCEIAGMQPDGLSEAETPEALDYREDWRDQLAGVRRQVQAAHREARE